MFGVLAAFLGGAANGASHQRWEDTHGHKGLSVEEAARVSLTRGKKGDSEGSSYWAGIAAGRIDETRSDDRKPFTWF